MSTIKDDDQFLVQRGDNSFKQTAKDLMSTIQDTDLMLVQRGTDSYKVTCEDVKDQLGGGGGGFTSVEITPLTITPESSDQYLTCSTDIPKVNGAVPADVIWNWYQYDGSTGDTGKTLLKTLTNRESVDTLLLPAGAANKYIGCSVEYLAVTIDETARCAVGQPSGPIAVMSGLRFDENRATYLQRSKSAVNAFTLSAWCKPTDTNVFRIYDVDNGSNYNLLQYRGTEKIVEMLSDVGTNQRIFSSQTFELNTWHHFVFTWDGTTGSIYGNGVKVAGGLMDLPLIAQNGSALIGRYFDGPQYSNGYLSDYYFVDGKVLEPTVFGEQFAEGWGPLDSTQVKENLNTVTPKEQPYDSRANTDQVWSSSVSLGGFTSADPSTNLFNGILSTADGRYRLTGGASGVEFTYTLDQTYASGTVAVKAAVATTGDAVLIVNNTEVAIKQGDANTSEWVEVSATSFNSLTVKRVSGSSDIQLFGVKVNGRLLVDQGVWNNSQNWSDGASGSFSATNSATKAFDGSRDFAEPTSSSTATFTFTPALTGTIEILSAKAPTVANGIVLNGSTNYIPSSENPTDMVWDNINTESGGSLSSITLNTTGNVGGILAGIKVNGAILVDAGAKWNTSQVWSDGQYQGRDIRSSNPITNGFDGSLTTECESEIINVDDDSTLIGTFTFPQEITVKNTVKIYANGSAGLRAWYLNSDVAGAKEQSFDGETLEFNFTGNLESFSVKNGSGSGSNATFRFKAIEIDGVLLVDGYGPGFGDNGFYLPFDPAQTGADYISGATVTGSADASIANLDSLFDGNPSSSSNNTNIGSASCVVGQEYGASYPAEFPAGDYEVLTAWDTGGGSLTDFKIILGSTEFPISLPGTATWSWVSIGTMASSFSGFAVNCTCDGAGNAGFYQAAVRVDGKILVDYSSIGVDMSGNENNFHDQNFGVGDSSQVWSKTASGPFTDQPTCNAYNGSEVYDVSPIINPDPVNPIILFEGSYPVTDTVSVLTWLNGNGNANITIHGTGNGGTPLSIYYSGATETAASYHDISYSGTVTKVTMAIQLNRARFVSIKMDGVKLIDPSFVDTVLDTPMKNYAVIDSDRSTGSSSNGNLESSTSGTSNFGTLAIPATGKYYFEAFPQGGVLNVGIGAYQVSAGNAYANPNSCLYASSGVKNVDTVTDQPFGPSYGRGDVIGVALDSDAGEVEFYKNGVSVGTISHTVGGLYPLIGDGGVSTPSSHNFGQQPFLHQPAGYEGVYQTWSQWQSLLLAARLEKDDVRISELERVIISQAVPLQRGSQYAAGSIVDIAGELYGALVDGADVSAADFVGRLFREGSDEWLKLGITTRQRPSFSVPTPTPDPTPDPTPQPPVIDNGTNSVVIDGGSFDQGL